MNKFSSLSTSVLLALLTSSFAAAAYASGSDNFMRLSNKQDDSAITKSMLPSINDTPDKLQVKFLSNHHGLSTSLPITEEEEEEQVHEASTTVPVQVELDPTKLPAKDDSVEVIETKSESEFVAHANTQAQLEASNIPLNTTTQQLKLTGEIADSTGFNVMELKFSYPSELQESLIAAGDARVLSYSHEDSNMMISVKVKPFSLDILSRMDYPQFKNTMLERFKNKEFYLYGEYELMHEFQERDSKIENNPKGMNKYFDISFSGFIKKPADGILPDMHNYFMERNILHYGYHTTIKCEFQGRQSEAAAVNMQFEAFKPLCQQVLDSFSYAITRN